MYRQIVYIGQIPQDTDLLLTNKFSYIGLAKLAAGVLGLNTLLNGFTCIQTGPASMVVNVTPGEMYSLQNIDNSGYGSLVADTAHAIMKQGVSLDNVPLTLTAPGTVGNSWNVLIQIGFSETDGGSTVLPYYDASNPSVPWAGPGNDGSPQNTVRQDGVNIQAKIGVQAPTGTQVTPSPDTGFTGAFVITIANGATTVVSGNISTYSGAPFITETLTQKISQATADLRYGQITAIQNGQYLYGVDTSGAANTITATLSPALGSYSAGMMVNIKVANTNTSTTTVNLNGLGAKNIILTNGGAISPSDLVAGGIAILTYDGTAFQLKNPAVADFSATAIQNNGYVYAVDSGAANAYVCALTPAITAYTAGLGILLKIANNNTTASTLNVNGLGTKNIKYINGAAIAAADLVAGGVAHLIYDGTQFQLLDPATLVAASGSNEQYCSDTGSADAYVGTLTSSPGSYIAGMRVLLKIANANTLKNPTVNFNSLGTKTIVNSNGNVLQAGDLVAGQVARLVYDGTNFQLLNPAFVPAGKNLIVAGDFGINPWQRGTSFTGVNAATYYADRWSWRVGPSATGVVTITQNADAPSVAQAGVFTQYSSKIQVTTAQASMISTDYFITNTRIEGIDFALLAQRGMTLYFWVKSNTTGTFYCSVRNDTSGVADRSFVSPFTIAVANTWQKVSVVIPASPSGGSDWQYGNLVGLVVDISTAFGSNWQIGTDNTWTSNNALGTASISNFMSSTSNYLSFALVKLEYGNVVTPWWNYTKNEVLNHCQRYYSKSYAQGTAPGTNTAVGAITVLPSVNNDAGVGLRFPITMRNSPTVSIFSKAGTSGALTGYTAGTDAGSGCAASNISDSGFLNISASSGISSGTQYYFHYTANGEIDG